MVLVAATFLAAVGFVAPNARQSASAESKCTSITDCQNKIAANDAAVAKLVDQATSYQDAIDHLDAQINQIQVTINASEKKQADLERQIVEKQAEINYQRKVLGEDLKAMYVDDEMTTIEMLATSKNLSDYLDKEQYRAAVQNKIQDTLDEITKLQHQLQVNKQQVEALLARQRDQRATLAATQSKKSSLLSYNKAQQASYNKQTAANKEKLAQLVAAQLAANRAASNGAIVGGSSSYPYANWPFSMSTAPGCVDGDGPDAWGYCTRQCVSYAAWAVAHSGRSAPVGYGNARDWVWNALNDRVPVYSFRNIDGYSGVHIGGPRAGDVAISTAGNWGHAMYIEGVSGTQIYVSQYNAGLDGQFSHQWRDASNYYFLRFP